MRSISQRELRNDSGEIMRQVRAGAAFQVTSRGTPVAVLAPIGRASGADLVLREAIGQMQFPPGVVVPESSADVLEELRGDR